MRTGLWQSGGHCLASLLLPTWWGGKGTQGLGHPTAQVCFCLTLSGAGQDPWGVLPLWGLLNP